MTEERLLRAFSELDISAMPDPAFADRLYQSLTAELGLEPAAKGATNPVVMPAQPVTRWLTGAPGRRRSAVLSLLAAALLLLATLAGALLIAGSRPEPRTPLEGVERSRAAYAQAPAVRFVIEDDMGATTVTGDGRGTWRSESWDMTPGSYSLYDGPRTAWYDATTRAWRMTPVENGGPPFPFNTHFTWTDISYPDLVATLDPVACTDAVAAPPMTIAGRETDGIACPKVKMTYWVDTETGLVLRAEAAFGSPYWNGGLVDPASGDVQDERPTVIEVSSFKVLASVDPADFDWNGPDLVPRTGVIPGTRLVVGERPATWTATDIDGDDVSLPGDGRPTAVLFAATWCPPCMDAFPAFDAAVEASGVDGLAVAVQDERGTVLGYRSQHPWSVPTIVDPVNALGERWGVMSVPSLVLLDASGRVVDVLSGRPRDTDLTATLAALAAGRPIPGPLPQPPASPGASPGSTPSPEDVCAAKAGEEGRVLCVEVGDRVPTWQARTAAGEAVSVATLRGQPAILWLESPARCDGPCPDWVLKTIKDLGSIAGDYKDRATVLVMATNEPEPGDTLGDARRCGCGHSRRVRLGWIGGHGDRAGERRHCRRRR